MFRADTVEKSPAHEWEAVISRAKASAQAPVSHAAQDSDCCAVMRVRQARNANAITTGSMTIPEYAVTLASARATAAAATSSPRRRR